MECPNCFNEIDDDLENCSECGCAILLWDLSGLEVLGGLMA